MTRALVVGITVLALTTMARAGDGVGDGSGAGSPGAGSGSAGGPGTGSAGDTTTECLHSPDPAQCLASKADALPDFDKIRSPDSPAFTVLGVAPTQIERPTTPKQLAASLSGFASGGVATIPKNLAVEFWPYWLFSHPTLTAGQYQDRSFFEQLVENITVSIGTADSTRQTVDMTTHTDANLAVGLRTLVNLSAQPVIPCKKADYDQFIAAAKASTVADLPEAKEIDEQLRAALLAQSVDSQQLEAAGRQGGAAVEAARKRLADDASAIATLEGKLKSLKAARNATISSQLDKLCTDGSQEAKQGLVAELAVASSERFLDGKTTDSHYADTAAWITVAWEAPGWSVMALGRYLSGKVIGADRNRFVDTGARVIRSKDTYAVSVELLGRFPVDTPSGSTLESTYRVDAAVDYHLQDSTWLSISFGKDFAQSNASSFFSLANLKVGLGDPKIRPPSQATSK